MFLDLRIGNVTIPHKNICGFLLRIVFPPIQEIYNSLYLEESGAEFDENCADRELRMSAIDGLNPRQTRRRTPQVIVNCTFMG